MTTPTRTLRRRIDSVVLRWQARLDSDWSDRVLPYLLAVGLFVLLALMAFARVRSMEGTVDLAAYTQAIWLMNHGYEPVMTITTGEHVLASQVAVVLYPISLLSHLLAGTPALVLLNAASLAFAVVPIWRIARGLAKLRAGAAVALAVVYALYPAMHTVNLAGFHPEVLALPGLLYAAYYGLSRHWRRFVACCIFVVLCRADFGLVVAGLGALVWAEGRKPEGRAVLIGGLAYTALAIFVLEPHFGSSGPHVSSFATFGDTPLGILGGMVTQPGDVVSSLFREDNFDLLVVLFAPVAFLPFLAPRYLLPVVPLELFLLVGRAPRDAAYAQQTIALTAFIFLATAFALARIGRRGVERVTVDRRVLAVMVLAAAVFFVREGVSSPCRSPWAWGAQDIADAARIEAIERINEVDGRPVRASPSLLVDLAERPQVYRLDPTERPDVAAIADGVDAVVLDDRSAPQWNEVDRQLLRDGLERLGFERISAEQGIELYLRPAEERRTQTPAVDGG